MLNGVAEGFADIGRKEGRIHFESAVKVLRGLLTIVHVVLGEAAVKKNVDRVVDRQALQKLLIFAEVKIAVHGRAVYFDLRIVLSRPFALLQDSFNIPPNL